jgi:hypothetical protein
MKRNLSSPAEYSIQSSNVYRIPVSSGIELGATITRPEAQGRFPALVWYDPYRSCIDGEPDAKSAYFARRGYAFVHLHVRGTGNSEGYSTDEYTTPETQDGVDAIAWLAAQAWCSGRVGMSGASYSGFTTLQVAAEAPSALQAIAPAYFTDQRYSDDCHYKGGNLRGYYDMLGYGLVMVARNGLPARPEAVGAKWSRIWNERLQKSEPYLLEWLSHQTDGAYWKTGSIAGRCDQIKAAAMLIAGWNDGYLNPPFRVFRALKSPKKLLIGPWSHGYPNESNCGPRIDIHFELLRWWDHWLKDLDNGVMDEPALQVYERVHETPNPDRQTIAGRWRMAAGLPAAIDHTLYLDHGRLSSEAPDSQSEQSVPYLPAASRNGGMWDAGIPFNLPGEQTEDSAHAVNACTGPLQSDLAIMGNVFFDVYVSSTAEIMPLALRLVEIDPQGTQVLVAKGILNMTRRDGMKTPKAMVPGQITRIRFHMEATGWRFQAGNRIGLSINGSDFPNVWPTPHSGRMTVHWGPAHPSHIVLPTWDSGDPPSFDFLPSHDPPRSFGESENPWQVTHDVLAGQYRLKIEGGDGEMGVSHRDPSQVWIRSTMSEVESWPGVHVESQVTGSLNSTADHFMLNIVLNVQLNGQPYFQKQWSETFPRELL